MKTILVIGGGFAGVSVARDLMSRSLPDCEVLLISEESYTTYNPMLPEAVGAAVFPEHVVAPLREVVGVHKRGRFVMGRMIGLDAAATHRSSPEPVNQRHHRGSTAAIGQLNGVAEVWPDPSTDFGVARLACLLSYANADRRS